MKIDYETRKPVELDELNKVDQLIYESQNEFLQEQVSDYFIDSKNVESEHLHYNKILGDDSVNIAFITLKKIIDTYCTDTSEDIFMIMNQILDPILMKFYEEKEITDLLDYAISEHYNSASLEHNPLLQVLKEKNTKYFEYANHRIEGK